MPTIEELQRLAAIKQAALSHMADKAEAGMRGAPLSNQSFGGGMPTQQNNQMNGSIPAPPQSVYSPGPLSTDEQEQKMQAILRMKNPLPTLPQPDNSTSPIPLDTANAQPLPSKFPQTSNRFAPHAAGSPSNTPSPTDEDDLNKKRNGQ